MTTLTIPQFDADQGTAIRIFLDALHVEYRTSDDLDEIEYLLSSPANAAHLRKSMEQAKNGDVKALSFDDIGKPEK